MSILPGGCNIDKIRRELYKKKNYYYLTNSPKYIEFTLNLLLFEIYYRKMECNGPCSNGCHYTKYYLCYKMYEDYRLIFEVWGKEFLNFKDLKEAGVPQQRHNYFFPERRHSLTYDLRFMCRQEAFMPKHRGEEKYAVYSFLDGISMIPGYMYSEDGNLSVYFPDGCVISQKWKNRNELTNSISKLVCESIRLDYLKFDDKYSLDISFMNFGFLPADYDFDVYIPEFSYPPMVENYPLRILFIE